MLKLYCVEFQYDSPNRPSYIDYDHIVVEDEEEAKQYAADKQKAEERFSNYNVRIQAIWEIYKVQGHRIIVE